MNFVVCHSLQFLCLVVLQTKLLLASILPFGHPRWIIATLDSAHLNTRGTRFVSLNQSVIAKGLQNAFLKRPNVRLLLSSRLPPTMICFKGGIWNWTESVPSLSGYWVHGCNAATTMNADILCKGRKRGRSECGISWGPLCGRSALVYSVQLNKLKCQGHNASGTSWKGGEGPLLPAEVLSSPITHVAVSIYAETHNGHLRDQPLWKRGIR